MFDSDGIGGDGDAQDAWIQNADPIDLSTYPNVLLNFESYYRDYQGGCYVETSANGSDWTQVQIHTDITTNNSSDNPTLLTLDVSSTIGGEATAYIRFRYIGGWDYAWMVDDVALIEQPAVDLKMNYSVVSHQVATGLEYGRVPAEQIADIAYGVEFMNFGTETQENSSAAVTMTDPSGTEVYSGTTASESVASGDTVYSELVASDIAWEMGEYNTEFLLTSDGESDPDGENFGNNTDSRVFAISNVYGLDGIGVYPNASTSSLGTTSFEDGEDGFMVMTRYEILEEQTTYGIECLLRTNGTDAGAVVFAALLSYEDVDSDIVGEDAWLATSDEYEVTAEDISNGYLNILFDDVYDLEPGSYYAALQLNSTAGTNNIAILDDTTVPQPADASVIYIPEDQVYTNGNAMAIRLMMDEQGSLVGLEDIPQVNLAGQNVPNPAVDMTRIDFELLSSQEVNIVVTDIMGKVVLSENLGKLPAGKQQYLLDVRGMSAGTHFYTIQTEQGAATQKMTVIK